MTETKRPLWARLLIFAIVVCVEGWLLLFPLIEVASIPILFFGMPGMIPGYVVTALFVIFVLWWQWVAIACGGKFKNFEWPPSLWIRLALFALAAIAAMLFWERLWELPLMSVGTKFLRVTTAITVVLLLFTWWRQLAAIVLGGRFWAVEWPPRFNNLR